MIVMSRMNMLIFKNVFFKVLFFSKRIQINGSQYSDEIKAGGDRSIILVFRMIRLK